MTKARFRVAAWLWSRALTPVSGGAIAETFAAAGAAVAVTDRDAGAAEAVAAAIAEGGGRAVGADCDVTKESDLVASVDRAVSEFGGLTILDTNAGGGPKPTPSKKSDALYIHRRATATPKSGTKFGRRVNRSR